ncbi:MAG: hypothetical protein KGS72_16485, partial [Cyanobacteria bacterium REEB67]|nr:hypothetical protein [Cyanobacteria bacterium REEB67]
HQSILLKLSYLAGHFDSFKHVQSGLQNFVLQPDVVRPAQRKSESIWNFKGAGRAHLLCNLTQ